MPNVVWFSITTNSVGRAIDTRTHKRLRDARDAITLSGSGYIERQEWDATGKSVESQLIVEHVDFLPSADEKTAIQERITVMYPSLNLYPAHWN